MIETILWDVDGTLLDFDAAEKAAIRKLFSEFDLGECTYEMLERYSRINVSFWQRLERNELTRSQILTGRFEQFFTEYGIDPGIAEEFNSRYQLSLGDTIVFHDDSPKIVKALKGKVKQYVVSNGTVIAQTRKLEKSGFKYLMDGIFLSEQLGVEKPDPAFFEKVFNESTFLALVAKITLSSKDNLAPKWLVVKTKPCKFEQKKFFTRAYAKKLF